MVQLSVDSVQLAFGEQRVLQNVYLNCMQGEIVGLLGRNGCGKSSLLKIIFGTLKPAYKYISIDNQHIVKGYHQQKIAYAPQQNYLPKGILIKELAKMLVDEFLWDNFTISEIWQRYYNSRAEQLSGGELRQLEMLMLLYSKADFILLDEPFTHISPVQAEGFKMQLREVAKHKGIIVTDHLYHNILDVSDRIFLLHEGYTRQINSPEELVHYGYLNGL